VQESPRPQPEPVEFRTDDGVVLRGELVRPADAVAAAIVCHPHPQYGGNRFDHVVGALFDALPGVGVAALRFDFRSEFGGGVAEVSDARAAVGHIAQRVPRVPLIAAGYSFGAMIALALDPETGPIAGKLLVAPPLAAMEVPATPEVPTLVVTPEHDQFTPPAAAEPIVAAWGNATWETVPMADHFLHGRTAAVVDVALAWVDDLLA
jgi:hypothetical protein